MNLEKVYRDISKTGKVTLERLKKSSIDDETIERFLADDILVPVEGEEYVYKVGDVYNLFLYGRELIADSEFRSANQIFDICYKLEPDNFLVNYQLFYRILLKKKLVNADRVFKYFDVVYKHLQGTERECDANFYLLLVGYVFGVPDEYSEVFSNIELEDITLDGWGDKLVLENKLRTFIINNSYYDANKAFDERFSLYGNNSFEDKLEKELLLKVMVKNRGLNKIIYECVTDNQIKELKQLLDTENEKRFLSKTNQYLLRIINQYLTIMETRKVPDVVKSENSNIFESINANDFTGALKLANSFQIEKNISRKSTIQLMLEKINKLIDEIGKNHNKKEEQKEVLETKEDLEYKSNLDEIKQLGNYTNESQKGIKGIMKPLVEENNPKIKDELDESENNKLASLYGDFLVDLINLVHNGEMNLEEACKDLNLTSEQINCVKLLYARDCYYLGEIKKGDIYLRQVEKSKDKTSEIKKLMQELQLSKKFYFNRLDEDRKQLVFRKR